MNTPPDTRPLVDVAVGIVIAKNSEVLLAQRPIGKPYGGWWEFPGGKLEPGESVDQALRRELHEELGLNIGQITPWLLREHSYEHARVRLYFRRIVDWHGEPIGREGQSFCWTLPQHASVAPLLPATQPLLRLLAMPPIYAISCAGLLGSDVFLARLRELSRTKQLGLLQLREPSLNAAQFDGLFRQVRSICLEHRIVLLINSQHPRSYWSAADGVHLRSSDALAMQQAPRLRWVAASCHNAVELAHAASIGADLAVLGPVLATASHPGAAAMTWNGFTQLTQRAALPTFALGGLKPADLTQAQQAGAHGVAMIRGIFA